MASDESDFKGKYKNRITCKCATTPTPSSSAVIKHVGTKCRCTIGKSFETDKVKFVGRVFVQEGDPENPF